MSGVPATNAVEPAAITPSLAETERYLKYYQPALTLGLGDLHLFALPTRTLYSHSDLGLIAREAVAWTGQRQQVYLHIHLHDLSGRDNNRGRGRIDSVRVAIGLFADIDARGPNRTAPPESLCPTQEDAVWIAQEFGQRHGIQPSFIVTSGHGCYPSLLFQEPFVVAGPADRDRLDKIGHRYTDALRAIAGGRGWTAAVDHCDLAKVLRLPGTINWKDPQDPRPVRLTRETSARYSIADLEDTLPQAAPRGLFQLGTAGTGERNEDPRPAAADVGTDADEISLAGDPEFVKSFVKAASENVLEFGAIWNYQRGFSSCSQYDMALASFGVRAGLSDEQIAALVIENRKRYPLGKQPRKGPHYVNYLKRTIGKARAGGPQSGGYPEKTQSGADTPCTGGALDSPNGKLSGGPETVAPSAVPNAGAAAENGETQGVASGVQTGAAPARRVVSTAPQSDGIIKLLADNLEASHHFARDIGERLYVHRNGTYVPGDLWVRERVQRVLEQSGKSSAWSSHRGREVVQYLVLRSPQLWEQPPNDEVNLQNGILNIWTGSLRPHDPDFLSPIQVPVMHDPAAKCPAWEAFIAEAFPADTQELAWEIVGDLITPDRSTQKAILLTGEGGNGKGVFLSACLAFVGKPNVSTVPLHKLEEDRFSASRLYGKLVNCCADLPSAHLRSTSMFKALTGGDIITGERKYENAFDFRPYARLLFSANHPPRSDDASKAFFDRWIVVPFERSFRGTDRERPRGDLDAALADPKELSGVLNRSVPALRRVRKSGRFTETAATRRAMVEFLQVTDPLTVWLERETITLPNATVPCASLLFSYNADAAKHGRPPMNQTGFGAAVRRLRPAVEVKKRGARGEQRDHYIGIGYKLDPDSHEEGGW